MKLGFTPEQEAFRLEARGWLDEQLSGPFASLRGHMEQSGLIEERKRWEGALGAAGWSTIGWPKEYGGRDAELAEQVIFAEEYARSGAPGRIGHIGIELAGPTILHFGREDQKRRFLPAMQAGKELWAQGYSEPGAGSDLSNVRTRARLEDGPNGREWVIEGQKIWTSLAQYADWIFVLARTEEGSVGPKGLSFLLVPLHQDGITIRPIRQITGDAEFNETFFDGARTAEENIVGAPGEGWKVALGLLGFERGVSTLAQQMSFRIEFAALLDAARKNGALNDPGIRQRIAQAHIGLKGMRYSALRTLSDAGGEGLSGAALTYKIYWASWRRSFGELVMDVLGPSAEIADAAPYDFHFLPRMFLGSRADTIYGGTNQIQRNLIAERALGLPREPRG
ncbi:acyl-CoA dehydrogenase family protein [Sphingomonas sp. C3-2]|uniref:acyl-CoA dehydrogenase family protein n=1 Tax=Sphingomonas sp. C3-2 TaxID=3062169 RepID=UPI00294B0C00|nr:acyl-CoA dehydrogenase family protein [Sphingomonas sp. C3-2]WOK38170.1 acyl-CoA dehydrogenase family protein [Sphingomonas sp. C3-2]